MQSFIEASKKKQPRKSQHGDRGARKDLNPLGNFILDFLGSSSPLEDEKSTIARQTLIQMIENPEIKTTISSRGFQNEQVLGHFSRLNNENKRDNNNSREASRANDELEKPNAVQAKVPRASGNHDQLLNSANTAQNYRSSTSLSFPSEINMASGVFPERREASELALDDLEVKRESELPLRLINQAINLHTIISGPPSEEKEKAYRELNEIRYYLYENYRISLV